MGEAVPHRQARCWRTQGERRSLPPMVCVWMLAVPLLDMARVMFVRLLRGESMLEADRAHFHHLLLARGHSAAAAGWILIGASALAGSAGVGAWTLGVPDWAMFYAFVALLAAVLGFTRARQLAVRGDDRLQS